MDRRIYELRKPNWDELNKIDIKELKACPFCGKTEVMIGERECGINGTTKKYGVFCGYCGVDGPRAFNGLWDACKAWNRRPIQRLE